MSEVIFKIEREDGEIFIIDDTEWRIPNDGLSGWHSTNSDISMFENTMTDGSIITQQRVPAVDRTITAEARDSSASHMLRTVAERFFVPHKTYTVHATYMGRTRKFEGVQAAFTLSEGNIHKPITLVWTITCPSPYSMGENESVGASPFSVIEHGSGMPYLVLGNDQDGFRKGFVTGVFSAAPNPEYGTNEDDYILLKNNGDVASRPVFYIKCQKKYDGAENFNGAILDVDIMMMQESDGSYSPMYDRRLAVKATDWTFGGEDPSEEYTRNLTDYMRIDLSKRPFSVESVAVDQNGNVAETKRERFEIVFDGLISNSELEQGDSVFMVVCKLKDNVGFYTKSGIEKYATLENLYTGV